MMRHLFTLFLITISLPLLAQIISITLQDGETYTLDKAGATYTVTSNNAQVNARLIVTASTKLILDNCHILRTDEGAPITINASGVTLEIQIKNTNTICTNYNTKEATSVISADYTYAPTLIFAEAPNAPTNSELLLRGSSSEKSSTAPVHLNKNGTNKSGAIIFRSGTVRIATSEGKNSTYSSWIPYLATANDITFSGGTIIAQICPRDGLGINYSNLTETQNIVRRLFNCNSFMMTGGLLTTEGEPCSEASHILKCKNEPYDTYFSYAPALMEDIVPAGVTPIITGGMKRTTNKLFCYGLLPNTTYPKGAFTHTETGRTTDETGTLTMAYGTGSEGITLNYANTTSEAIVKVFNATPRPSEKGCTAKADFGISNITLNAETLYPELHLTLDLHDDPSAVLEKTVYVRIYCTVNTEDRVMIAEQPLTFTRNAAGKPFTATFTDVSKARSASTTTRYTIEAYN